MYEFVTCKNLFNVENQIINKAEIYKINFLC